MVNQYTFEYEVAGYTHQIMIEDFTPESMHAGKSNVYLFHIMFIDGPEEGFALAGPISKDPMCFYEALRGTPVMTNGKPDNNTLNPMKLPKPGAGTDPIVESTLKANLTNDAQGIKIVYNVMSQTCACGSVCGSGMATAYPAANGVEPVLMDLRFALAVHFCTTPGPTPQPQPGPMPMG
jgi:hypothetical protein